MKMIITIALVAANLWASVSVAAEHSRVVTVTKVHPIGPVRPAGVTTQNTLRIYVNWASWGNSSCRADAADISGDDWLLISTFLQAWKDGRTITMYVDDTLRVVSGDTVCRVTTMGIE